MFPVTTSAGKQWRATRTLYMETDENGKSTHRAVQVSGTGFTREDAIARRDENYKKRLVKSGELPLSALRARPKELKTTTAEMLWNWHTLKTTTAHTSERVSLSVGHKYASHIRLHIEPHIGTIPVRLLTREHIEQLLFITLPAKRKMRNGKETEEQLLGATPLRTVQNILNMACREAVSSRQIVENPMTGVAAISKPKPVDESLEKQTWKPRRLMKNLAGTEDEARWILSFLGFRQSERLGLTWDRLSNLTPKAGKKFQIEIRQQLDRNPKTGEIYIRDETKTNAGKRIIPMEDRVAAVFRAHKKRQDAWKKTEVWAPLKGMENLVFTTPEGKPIRHQTDNKQWKALLRDNNIPFVRQHGMRHIAVSMMVKGGAPIEVVRAIAGHHSESLTRAVYLHLGVKDKEGSMSILTTDIYREVDEAAQRKTAKLSQGQHL